MSMSCLFKANIIIRERECTMEQTNRLSLYSSFPPTDSPPQYLALNGYTKRLVRGKREDVRAKTNDQHVHDQTRESRFNTTRHYCIA